MTDQKPAEQKIDLKKFRMMLPKVKDPIRHPKIIGPMEQEMKDDFDLQMNKMIVDVTKRMVDMKKMDGKIRT